MCTVTIRWARMGMVRTRALTVLCSWRRILDAYLNHECVGANIPTSLRCWAEVITYFCPAQLKVTSRPFTWDRCRCPKKLDTVERRDHASKPLRIVSPSRVLPQHLMISTVLNYGTYALCTFLKRSRTHRLNSKQPTRLAHAA
jgi:hypothetical protein